MSFVRFSREGVSVDLKSYLRTPEGKTKLGKWRAIDVQHEAHNHMLEALRGAAKLPCRKSNCGTVCLCTRCHAREALKFYDPNWRPR